MRRSKSGRMATFGMTAPAFLAVSLAGTWLGPIGTARAQDIWTGAVNNQYNNAGNWTAGVPDGASITATISNTANNSVTISGINPTLGGLTLGSAVNSLSLGNGNSLTIVGGPISTAGAIFLNANGNSTDLRISGNVTLSGATGIVTLSNDTNNRIYSANGSTSDTLTNVNNTIQGAGQIGVNGMALVNQANGIISANQSNTLTINASTTANAGLIQASGGGQLALSSAVNNAGGTILSTGAGSFVSLAGSTVSGGTLVVSGGGAMNVGYSTLSGLRIFSGSTVTVQNGANTTLAGTITNYGTIALNANGNSTDLRISGNVMLGGGEVGIVSLSNDTNNRILGNSGSSDTLTNVNNTIRGAGQIGVNGMALVNQANGTINANSSQNLTINASTTANAGLIEASGGGQLALSSVVNNAGGTILSTGTNSVASLYGSSITGGTLTTASGGAMYVGGSTLSGLTVSTGSTATVQNNSGTTLVGTITNNGTIALNSTGNGTDLIIGSGTVTHTGGGTIAMSNDTNNRIYSTSGGTLINDTANTIQGAGQIGAGNNLFLVNKGTIDANVSNSLTINASQTATNTGLIEATSGGSLNVQSAVNNAGGTILSSGTNSVASLYGSSITGGTLTTASGGAMYVGGSTLSGLTVSTGSTATVQNNSGTTLVGTITNNGTIALNSTGNGTDIRLSGNVTLNGTGSITMTNDTNNRIYGNTGSEVLTNGVNHTIQGSGQLGVGQMSIINNGTILANQSYGLSIVPNGSGITNNGTFQASTGSILSVTGNLTNFSGTTLTGGTYNAISTNGTPTTIQFTGADVATNAATIRLDGVGTQIIDQNGNDALRHFTANALGGSFTIQDGRNFTSTSASDFTNAGSVTVGPNSTFTVGSAHDYLQTGGTTFLSSSSSTLAVEAGHQVNIEGGTLAGFGTVAGNLVNSGTVSPGASPGTLSVVGNYTQSHAGAYNAEIGGTSPGGGYDVLAVSGTATLDGALNLSLINGFTPFNGETFIILTSTGLNGTFSTVNGLNQGNDTFSVDYGHINPNDVTITVLVNSVPEPASLLMLGLGLVGLGAVSIRRAISRRR